MIFILSLFFFILIKTVRLIEFSEDEILTKAANDMKFAIYTRKNPDTYTLFDINDDSLKNTTFDKEKPVKIIVHGWTGKFEDTYHLKNEYLTRYDANVIAVDYSKDAARWYYTTVKEIPIIGAAIGYLIDKMVFEFGVDSDLIHILGYSLGGQVAGVGGMMAKKKVGRATGMDPASFAYPLSKKLRLSVDSAKFVDVIHTYWRTGYTEPFGHVDFFPNGGDFQPEKIWFESHYKALAYFLESINSPGGFLATSCPSWVAFQKDQCPLDAQITEMGEHVNPRARGSFYLTTNADKPFAKGEASLIYDN